MRNIEIFRFQINNLMYSEDFIDANAIQEISMF
jgi:hypothetical protein